jgi:MFS family permease
VFTQIFLYERFASVPRNIIATLVFYAGIMVGFVVFGYVASIFRLNIKIGFPLSFMVMAAAVVLLLFSHTVEAAYFAMGLSGIGEGLFWLTIHTFELSETKDNERDFYSSMLSAGGQILSLAGPAVATLLIWLSATVFNWGTFTLLFLFTPLVYLLGLFCFSGIQDYRPARVEWADLVHFLSDKRNHIAQFYLMGTSFQNFFSATIPPLVILFILGTSFRVGIYSTLFAILSTLCILVLARHRTTENRLFILTVATVLLAIMTVLFGYFFTFVALVVYTVAEGILQPILRVSIHVIDLQTMESIGRSTSDFYATMLLRDFSLFVWRSIAGLGFLLTIGFLHTEKESLVAGIYFLAFSLLAIYAGARLLLKSAPRIHALLASKTPKKSGT